MTADTRQQLAARADALLYNMCPTDPRPEGARPDTPVVSVASESPYNYDCLNQPEVMRKADIDMSYRSCAQVQAPYYNSHYVGLAQLQADPVPFKEKLNAILHISSNCKTNSHREDAVSSLQEQLQQQKSSLQLHSYGECARNMGEKELKELASLGVTKLSRRYKFCLAMENTIEMDYITEKVYHALESGCIPIYYGAPNVNDYIPDAAGIINYSKLRSPAALLKELERLAADESAYSQMLAWRKKSLQELAPGFQRLYDHTKMDAKCRLCQLLVEHRKAPKKYTMCYANTTWQEAGKKAAAEATVPLPTT
eukprot:gene9873-10031_t